MICEDMVKAGGMVMHMGGLEPQIWSCSKIPIPAAVGQSHWGLGLSMGGEVLIGSVFNIPS